MPTKTISIDMQAFRILRRERKGPRDSYSQVIQRLYAAQPARTVEEFCEKRGREAARELAARFAVLGLHVGDALRCGLMQSRAARRLGENDAWLAAQALRGDCALVTRARRFDEVPGLEVVRY